MEQDRKTEIVAEQLMEALEKLREKYGQEIAFSFDAEYSTGVIIIKVKA